MRNLFLLLTYPKTINDPPPLKPALSALGPAAADAYCRCTIAFTVLFVVVVVSPHSRGELELVKSLPRN